MMLYSICCRQREKTQTEAQRSTTAFALDFVLMAGHAAWKEGCQEAC